MEPRNQTDQGRLNHILQIVVVALLCLIIVAGIGGYIYYGMQSASVAENTEEEVVAIESVPAEDTPLTAEERVEILRSLASSSEESNLTREERLEILSDLRAE